MVNMSNEILTPEQAADYLHVNREVLRRLSQDGKIHGAFKVGKQWRYLKSELTRGEHSTDENSK